jgi:uncharacterized cupin superfamily protein
MHVVRFLEAPSYMAPGHFEMTMRWLQGREAGASNDLWIGISVIEPGGGTTLSSSPEEKMYVVLDGELKISNGKTAAALALWDSCRIAPGEDRQLQNASTKPAVVLLAMPLPPSERG